MPKPTADQGSKPRSNQRPSPLKCLGVLGLVLLLSLTLGRAAVNYLVPKVPNRAPGVAARWEWYFGQGQFQADCRTFAAAVQFLLDFRPNIPVTTNYASLPLLSDPAANVSKS